MEGSQENGLKKGPWSAEEDELLIDCVKKHGQGNWQRVPQQAGLNRCGKSCRLRWTNYLKPGIKRGGFSEEEEATIIALHRRLGNKWSRIAAHLPRRTDNEIKNYWNTHLRKKLLRMGIDPKTHKPIPPDLNNILNNLSQTHLFTASSSNLYNCMNPLDAAALNLQANANDLIKIQILQNILQLVKNNPSPLPYFQGNINTFSTFDHPLPLQPDLSNISSLLNDQNQQPSASNSFPWFEGETIVSPEPLTSVNDNVKFGSSYVNNNIPEYSLPSLVSITPESIQPTPETNVFDAWENLVDDDEANGSFWKNILG